MEFREEYFLKLKKPTVKLMALIDKRRDKYIAWLRSIIAMAVGFIGIRYCESSINFDMF